MAGTPARCEPLVRSEIAQQQYCYRADAMTHLLNCPVCGYKEIEGNICPNCDADLSLIRSLTELPALEKAESAGGVRRTPKVAIWQVGVALLILIFGIGLGTLGSFLFLQPQLARNTVNSPSSVAIKGDKTPLLPNPPAPFPSREGGVEGGAERRVSPLASQYVVKSGDNLTVLTEKFCGKGNSWQVMVNPLSSL